MRFDSKLVQVYADFLKILHYLFVLKRRKLNRAKTIDKLTKIDAHTHAACVRPLTKILIFSIIKIDLHRMCSFSHALFVGGVLGDTLTSAFVMTKAVLAKTERHSSPPTHLLSSVVIVPQSFNVLDIIIDAIKIVRVENIVAITPFVRYSLKCFALVLGFNIDRLLENFGDRYLVILLFAH